MEDENENLDDDEDDDIKFESSDEELNDSKAIPSNLKLLA